MNTLLDWLTAPEWTPIVKSLLHSLWQAGLLAMGDLSHALETLFVRIGEASNGATPAALDLVQRGLDELQQMRDSIDAGRAISPAAALVAELEGFDAARAEPAAAPAPSQRAPAIPATPPSAPVRAAEPLPPVERVDLDLAQPDEIVLETPEVAS